MNNYDNWKLKTPWDDVVFFEEDDEGVDLDYEFLDNLLGKLYDSYSNQVDKLVQDNYDLFLEFDNKEISSFEEVFLLMKDFINRVSDYTIDIGTL